MASLKDFFNKISNDNRIFTREDIGNMSTDEFRTNEKAIDYQLANLGVPTNSDMANSDDVVYVKAYTKDDGTKVKAHYRSKRGSTSISKDNTEYNNSTPWNTPFISPDNFKNYPKDIMNLYESFYKIPKDNGMTVGEELTDNLGHIASQNYNIKDKNIGLFPIAGANLQNAMRDFEFAKENSNAHIINSRSEIKNKGLNNLMDEVGIPKNSRGVIYDINSKQSKNLFKSPEIQDFISKNFSTLTRSKQNPNAHIEFQKHSQFDDNYYGLQNCKLYNPHITPDGYFNATIVDYFDFKYRNGSDFSTKVNNWGYSMQEKGFLENQFNIYQIQEKLW